ncbi:thioredoxin domain-containing protein [Piscinibacter terrae]|uniref:Thioredoxin domain-containing protein n=1 Tax=Piscinibacter terrae TaxID=2496871 RepID=A0A3N7JZA9_9BURK|nr:thioredoxin domain-containing protein [Albitalea terrae]RQP26119.1 hypothetical protein DZC73_03495 [Albitalea terrae]
MFVRWLSALAVLMLASMQVWAAGEPIESVEPGAIEALVQSHKTGMLVVSITSLDSNCRPCIRANTEFQRVAKEMGGKARFVQVAWQPWSRFPTEIQPFLKQYGIPGVPARLVFQDGKFEGKMIGEPPPPPKPSPLNVTGSIEQVDPTKAEQAVAKSSGVVVVMLSSFETQCVFCMKANPLFESLAQRTASGDAKVKYLRVMYRPWTSVTQDHFGEKLQVNGLPVFLTYKDGQPVRRRNGIAEVGELEKLLLDGVR